MQTDAHKETRKAIATDVLHQYSKWESVHWECKPYDMEKGEQREDNDVKDGKWKKKRKKRSKKKNT